ncbi:hypothetical protein PG996_005956 [Apiospora saccharicola]|uniref:Uncharacterized protein n=1 Tax=Apiospora saccharicola TaxID=335842 RepID=A0ABR1VN26_9PEZI
MAEPGTPSNVEWDEDLIQFTPESSVAESDDEFILVTPQSTVVVSDDDLIPSFFMAEAFRLIEAPVDVRHGVYSSIFANGDGKNLLEALPDLLRKEALPKSLQKGECLSYLTIQINAFDLEHRDAWLKIEWKTAQGEVFSQVFIHLDHEIIRHIIDNVGEVDQLNIIIDPSAAAHDADADADLTQILYLWIKVREVASLLSKMKHWGVQNLAIKMTSVGPSTFKLTSRRLGKLPFMVKSDYNFLSLVHMAIFEPLISGKKVDGATKMSATSLEWYYQILPVGDITADQDLTPDRGSTPEPILTLIDGLGAFSNGPVMWNLRDEYSIISTFFKDVTLARMRVEEGPPL